MTHQTSPVYTITDTHPWIRVSREVPSNFTPFQPCSYSNAQTSVQEQSMISQVLTFQGNLLPPSSG